MNQRQPHETRQDNVPCNDSFLGNDFVGLRCYNFDVVKLVSCGDAEGSNANITNNAKEVHPYLVGGEGSQFMVTFANCGYSDHQTSKGATNNVSLCDIIVPMSQLPTQQSMHSS
jgi:hypothetical protein